MRYFNNGHINQTNTNLYNCKSSFSNFFTFYYQTHSNVAYLTNSKLSNAILKTLSKFINQKVTLHQVTQRWYQTTLRIQTKGKIYLKFQPLGRGAYGVVYLGRMIEPPN